MTPADFPYDDVVAAARRIIDTHADDAPPTSLVDQYAAAARDTWATVGRMAPLLAAAEPDQWGQARQLERTITAELQARIFATYMREARTKRNPTPDENDRCDWCGRRDVTTFVPLTVAAGPILVLGDACPDCAAALRADTEART